MSKFVVNISEFIDDPLDHTKAIQKAINHALKFGISKVNFDKKGPYIISDTIKIFSNDVIDDVSDNFNLHFIQTQTLMLTSDTHAEIKVADNVKLPNGMFAILYSAELGIWSSIPGRGFHSPFYIKIDGLQLNGNNNASTGILLSSSFHPLVENCSIYNCDAAIVFRGYSVGTFSNNVIRCNTCFVIGMGQNKTGGSDSLYSNNDLYPSKYGFVFKGYAGDCKVVSNKFTAHYKNPDDKPIAIFFDSADETILDYQPFKIVSSNPTPLTTNLHYIYVHNNMFDGFNLSILSNEDKTKNSKSLLHTFIAYNHFILSSGLNDLKYSGAIELNNAGYIHITNNAFRSLYNRLYDNVIKLNNTFRCHIKDNDFMTSNTCLNMINSKNCIISNNIFGNSSLETFKLNNCSSNMIQSNQFLDDTNKKSLAISFSGTSFSNYIKDNFFNGYNGVPLLADTKNITKDNIINFNFKV